MRRPLAKLRFNLQSDLPSGWQSDLQSRLRRAGGVVAVLAVAMGVGHAPVVAAQFSTPNQLPGSPPPFGTPPDPNDPMQRQRLEKMEKARNVQRQEQLVRDTDKLLALAKELKEQVDKSNRNTLSVDVVKKAAEIEKLAKNVKDRMRE